MDEKQMEKKVMNARLEALKNAWLNLMEAAGDVDMSLNEEYPFEQAMQDYDVCGWIAKQQEINNKR